MTTPETQSDDELIRSVFDGEISEDGEADTDESTQDDAGKESTDDEKTTEQQAEGAKQGSEPQPAERADQPSKTQKNPHRVIRDLRRREEHLMREIERLKTTQAPAEKAADDGDADLIAGLEADMPDLAKVIKAQQAELKALRADIKPKEAAAKEEPGFDPVRFPANVQDVIDGMDDLLEIQHDPARQDEFTRICAMDGYLEKHPMWAGKPLADRFAEAMRRVAEESAPAAQKTTTKTTPKPDAKAVLASAKRVLPESLADIGGGTSAENDDLTDDKFDRMSDEDILTQVRMGRFNN